MSASKAAMEILEKNNVTVVVSRGRGMRSTDITRDVPAMHLNGAWGKALGPVCTGIPYIHLECA